MLNELKKTILSPSAAANEIAAKTSIVDGIKLFLIGAVLAGIISTIFTGINQVITCIIGIVLGTSNLGSLVTVVVAWLFGLIGFAIFFIPAILMGLVFSFIALGVVWLVGKLLGGKAPYGAYFGSMQYVSASFGILTAVVSGLLGVITAIVMGINGVLGALVALVMFVPTVLIAIYALWVTVVFTREVHKISTIKALASILIPVIVVGVVAAVFAVIVTIVFGVAIFGLLGGMKLF